MKLTNIPEFASMPGGRAIEILAKKGNVRTFKFSSPMSLYRDCSFSFNGLKQNAMQIIISEEKKYGKEWK